MDDVTSEIYSAFLVEEEGTASKRADHGKLPCAIVGSEAAGDLLAELHRTAIPLRQVVGKRDRRFDEKPAHPPYLQVEKPLPDRSCAT
jgi:hypothetical protein